MALPEAFPEPPPTRLGFLTPLIRRWRGLLLFGLATLVSVRASKPALPSEVQTFADPVSLVVGLVALVGAAAGAYGNMCKGRVQNAVTELLIDHQHRTISVIRHELSKDSSLWFWCGDLVLSDWWFGPLLDSMNSVEPTKNAAGGVAYWIPP